MLQVHLVATKYAKSMNLEPKYFDGVRDAKELENFLWDLKHYFSTSHVPENKKVTMVVCYYRNNAV